MESEPEEHVLFVFFPHRNRDFAVLFTTEYSSLLESKQIITPPALTDQEIPEMRSLIDRVCTSIFGLGLALLRAFPSENPTEPQWLLHECCS